MNDLENPLTQILLKIQRLQETFDESQKIQRNLDREDGVLARLEELLVKYQKDETSSSKLGEDLKELFGELIKVRQEKDHIKNSLQLLEQQRNHEIQQLHSQNKSLIEQYTQELSKSHQSQQTDHQILQQRIHYLEEQSKEQLKEVEYRQQLNKASQSKIKELLQIQRDQQQQIIDLQATVQQMKQKDEEESAQFNSQQQIKNNKQGKPQQQDLLQSTAEGKNASFTRLMQMPQQSSGEVLQGLQSIFISGKSEGLRGMQRGVKMQKTSTFTPGKDVRYEVSPSTQSQRSQVQQIQTSNLRDFYNQNVGRTQVKK